ncbi:MAG TPA: V-type ATP synthase subunit F [Candidatus Bathyarchaeia archaeon]|nr:V-type ATP synthase subunit F [Candidatus Bathyarchaeia archaeon]
MKIVSLTNPQIAMGLRLGGLKECYIISDPDEAGEKLLELSKDSETGIIIIDDDIARLHHKLIDNIRSSKKTFPIIVEIQSSDKKEITEGVDPLKDLIKRAIGVDISSDKGEGIPPKI